MKNILLIWLILIVGAFSENPELKRKPNIVFILADDLGWSDVGFNGARFYETPHLDRLCKTGMRFNRAYSGGPNCLPTRACLISGMYTPRTQIWTPGGKSKGKASYMKLKVPLSRAGGKEWDTIPSKLELEPSIISIAEVLKTAGYATARFGKWHVGKDTQGFDISDSNGKGAEQSEKWYGNIDVHEWLTDGSIKFIEENKDKPFFLYLSHWDVHTPIRARKDVVRGFEKKLEKRTWDRKWNVTYAAMIQAVDLSVKRVHDKLVELGLDKNTVFVFTSDNGGYSNVTTNSPLKGAKGALYEGGVRVPTFISWPETIKAGSTCDTPITSVDFMPTFSELAAAQMPMGQPVDGTSIVPLMKGKGIVGRSIFWHYPLYLQGSGEGKVIPISGTNIMHWRSTPSGMIMKDEWKVINFFEDNSFKLYNVDSDISESKDQSTEHPSILKKLSDELKQWQKDTNAPIPKVLNETFSPTVYTDGMNMPGKK